MTRWRSRTERSSLGRDLVLLVVLRVGALIISTGSGLLLARWLGPTQRGELAVVYSVASVIAIALQFGVPEASVLYLGDQSKSMGVPRILRAVMSCGWMFAVCAATATMILGLSLFDQFISVWVLAALFSGLSLHGTILRHLLLSLRGTTSFGILQFTESAALGAAVCLLACLTGPSVAGGIAAYLIGALVGVVAARFVLRRTELARWQLSPAFDGRVALDLVRLGAPMVCLSIMSALSQRGTAVVLASTSGAEQAGWYTAAAGVQGLLLLLPQQVATIAFAVSSKRGSGSDRVSFAWTIRNPVFLSLGLSALAAVAVALFANPVTVALYGRVFSPASVPLQILACGAVLSGVLTVRLAHLLGRGCARAALVSGLASFFTLATFLYPACDQLGMVGAAWVQVVSPLTGLLALAVYPLQRTRDAKMLR